MDGFKRLVFRLTPIIMLICFICIGITRTFSRESDTEQITYLTSEVITVDDKGTETTEDDITIENYTFDFTSYRENINANKLQQATEKVIDLETFNNQYSTFNLIWADGYQILDISKTILNAIIFFININLVAINTILMPIRLASAILITSFSLIGININRTEGIIIPFLNGIIKYLNIPLINSTEESNNGQYESIVNTTWIFDNEPNIPFNTNITITGIQFTSNGNNYTNITIKNRTKATLGNVITYEYGIWYNNTLVYDNTWTNDNYKIITINAIQNQNSNETLYKWLDKLATNNTPDPPIQPDSYGTIYTIQTYYVRQLNQTIILRIPFTVVDTANNTTYNYTYATFNSDYIWYWQGIGYTEVWNSTNGWQESTIYTHIFISNEQTIDQTAQNTLQYLIDQHVLIMD